jgi:3-phenylpropionate/trans-cinnamate dioxygenase ferredoxin subunit
MPQRHVVAAVAEIPAGERKLVTVAGREIGVFNVGGDFYALANRCPHEGGSLCEGFVTGIARSDGPNNYRMERKGEFLRCPWHGWEFDIRTGQSWCDPQTVRVRQFAVKVEHGEDLVKGPFVAETFDVKVDGDYLVIEL